MELTGTNKVMDLWADIQFIKNIANTSRDKKRLSLLYKIYKLSGGKKEDPQIEQWIEENQEVEN